MDVSVDRFDALLRDLLCYDLVVEEEPGRWRLRPAFEERMSTLAAAQRPASAPVLHIGVSCMGCHAANVTRLYQGRYLCDTCRAAARRQPHDADPGESDRRLVSRYRTATAWPSAQGSDGTTR